MPTWAEGTSLEAREAALELSPTADGCGCTSDAARRKPGGASLSTKGAKSGLARISSVDGLLLASLSRNCIASFRNASEYLVEIYD